MPETATNATLFYHPDGFDMARPNLMGRQSAGAGFLKGWVQHSGVDRLHICVDQQPHAEDFARKARAFGSTANVRWVPMHDPEPIAETGCLFYSSPEIEPLAWRRRRADPRGYSICGLTHTTASHAAMTAIANLVTAPVQDWDALICTSKSVLSTAIHLLEARAEYLRARVGATVLPTPQLPVIPLGVDCAAYAATPAQRQEWRRKLGIGPDDIVLLFVGRLSYHGKAHPLPMYLAAERAAKASGKRLHLIQAGWFATRGIEAAFRDGARIHCPSVNALFLDGRKEDLRVGLWAAADIFTSLSDNIQETFGLTPIEAMAAGLPSVVSDWNGYRETVRDGVDGLRIPTAMPAAGLGIDMARRLEDGVDSYDAYCGEVSQLVSVDVEACTEAYTRLARDPALRRRMGEAARTRARNEFDWRHVVRRYQELWRELAERRRARPLTAPLRQGYPANPTRPDPFAAFVSYPTATVTLDHEVSLRPGASMAALQEIRQTGLLRFVERVAVSDVEAAAIFIRLATGPVTARVLVEAAPAARRPYILRGLVWLQKLDLIKLRSRPPMPKTPNESGAE